MNSAELKRAKREVRRRVLARRDALPEADRARLGGLAVDHLMSCPELAAPVTVFAFWSFGSEVPTAPLLEQLDRAGSTVCLPRIDGADIQAVAYRPGDELRSTGFGAMEPARGTAVPASELDVIVVPSVAFDRDGRRVGYGGGYYDRFLGGTEAGAFRVGLAFALQVLDEALPSGSFDRRVDAVVTELGVRRLAATDRDG
jgi:5-formyltetrahydrofolate cyclo-ligase